MRIFWLLFFLLFATITNGQLLRDLAGLERAAQNMNLAIQYIETDTAISLNTHVFKTSKAPEHLVKIESKIQAKKYKKLEGKLLNIATENNSDFYSRRLLGDLFAAKNDETNARLWYEASIDASPHTWDSYFVLAQYFLELGDKESATRYALIAWIYNRNSEEVKDFIFEIQNEHDDVLIDWKFIPRAYSKIKGNTIIVSGNENWHAYALCQELWKQNEPATKKLKEIEASQFLLAENKECVLNLLNELEFAKVTPTGNDAHMVLGGQYALYQGYIDQFILFDIWLPQLPNIASQFTQEEVKKMMEYILYVR